MPARQLDSVGISVDLRGVFGATLSVTQGTSVSLDIAVSPVTWLVTEPGGIVARPAVVSGVDVRTGALGVLVEYVPEIRRPVRWTGTNFVEV